MSTIGHSFAKKSLGKRSALNAHAAFDEAGAGNTIRGAPALDPTCERFGGETPPYLLDFLTSLQSILSFLFLVRQCLILSVLL
jgi:hypothetical protein